jgi:hypothetical protein
MDQFSTFYWKKIIISSKTSSDRLKLIYKTKKKKLCPVSNHCDLGCFGEKTLFVFSTKILSLLLTLLRGSG